MSIQESIRYGAAELKRFYNRNLGMALAISVGFHLLLIFFYVFVSNAKTREVVGPPLVQITRLSDPPRPPENKPPSPLPSSTLNPPRFSGSPDADLRSVANPVAVPDLLVDTLDFPPTNLMGSALSHPGDGPGGGGTNPEGIGGPVDLGSKPLEMKQKETEEISDPGIFVSVEKEPEFDLEELHHRVVYPEIARRNGIEGKVTVQVYVDKRGKPVKVTIAQSDNKILEQAAVDAVMRTAFTPAIQNGFPIGVWVTIPIDFQLH